MTRLLALLLLVATPALAQDVADAAAAKLRVLDKLTGEVSDLTLAQGQSKTIGRLTVRMDDCRYYLENPAQEAFVHLTILDAASTTPDFDGWMTASSPALSALDHPRYDVWPLRCDVADLVLPDVETAPADGSGG
ncbi:DUF2155 domain-containing protein [Cypionkella sp.]|uniref:DUF2155 domain-containing protein n=1 Tax=Cypionkella sp. TaxID=2811411 RepID=UPI0027604B63|nr:DUF2155 domain-containing protein [Cypionkella sp.]